MKKEELTAPFAEVQDHGGEHKVFESGATREVLPGKGRYDLIPPTPIHRLAVHYENGARKYTTDITIPAGVLQLELVKWCTCERRTAIQVDPITRGGVADPVTNKNCGNGTQVLQSDNAPTRGVGLRQTGSENETSIRHTTETRETVSARHSRVEPECFESSDSTSTVKRASSNDKGGVVPSAKDHRVDGGFTSTTTIKPDESGVSSAGSVTRVLVSSEIVSEVLRGHATTCGVRQLKLTPRSDGSVGLWRTGDRNWEKGLPLSRFLDSAERHLNQFKAGERTEDHLAAVLWNIAGYIETEQRIRDGKLPETLRDVPWPDSTG